MDATQEQLTVVESPRAANFVARFWRGEYSLGVSYWVFGIGMNVVLYACAILLAFVAVMLGANAHGTAVATLPIALPIMVWYSVGLSASASNHIERTGRKFWATAAQVMLAVGWLSVLGQILTVLEH